VIHQEDLAKNPAAGPAQGAQRTAQAGDVVVVDEFKARGRRRQKDFVGVLSALEVETGSALMVTQDADKNLDAGFAQYSQRDR